MKKSLLSLILWVLCATLVSGMPPVINNQAVIRDADGELVKNQSIGLRVSIRQGNPTGSIVYRTTLSTTTDEQGLVSYSIGLGSASIGTTLSAIDWSQGPYFMQTDVSPTGDTDYKYSNTTILLSNPYAFHAAEAASLAPGTTPGEMQYWDGQAWQVLEPGGEGTILTFTKGRPAWVTDPATFECGDDLSFVYRGSLVTYGTLSRHGLCWLDRNLGASRVPLTKDDPEGYGDLFQAGRGDDGHQLRTSAITTTLSSTDQPGHGDFIVTSADPNDWRSPQNDDLWQGVNGTNNPCPPGWRVPTVTELINERDSWASSNADGAFESPLKFPVSGIRNETGDIEYEGERGYIVSSTMIVPNARVGIMSISDSFGVLLYVERGFGRSVRCVRD